MNDLEEYEKRQIELYNKRKGNLHLQDGIDCPECLNKGHLLVFKDGETKLLICQCEEQRKNKNQP